MATAKTAAAKSTTARVSRSKAAPVVVVDPDVYVPPTGLAECFQGNGSVTLARKLSRRALGNTVELARSGNTEAGRKFWNNSLRNSGVLGSDAPDLTPTV
ncbi:hypothetical protein SEA_TUNATARTARE_255 [Streptomyces phage TunaTartare]|uniref:Uncharacterized protein n=1 Tax=Streptomyces phage TunaTartare TaxID=2848887 RepID=A0A8F2E759_9CAUD|nr:hypothetical protein PP457_gp025 [Streptomyces phage TunaTartare]QWT30117.1 hypothetical protein SEA_TUNATARTARE_255 [Streptomyces phage TunaTartare]